MSKYDYVHHLGLVVLNPSFISLIMAAMTRSNSSELIILQDAFPSIYEELLERKKGSNGLLKKESDEMSEKEFSEFCYQTSRILNKYRR